MIIGLFWYKRRRIGRADPGGTVESNSQDNVKTSYVKEVISNLYDPTDEKMSESFSTSSCTQQEKPTRAPRKVSESMDIPNRKSVPQSCGSSQISTEVESTTVIQLGSNPTTNYFETIAKKRNTSSFDLELADNITEVFQDATEEAQCNVQNEMGSSEQNDTAAEFNHKTNKQLAEEPSEDNTATTGQAVYERDSANHSPISGVLEGSIMNEDEARSEEGSTDSGKGECPLILLKLSIILYRVDFLVKIWRFVRSFVSFVGMLISLRRIFDFITQVEALTDAGKPMRSSRLLTTSLYRNNWWAG